MVFLEVNEYEQILEAEKNQLYLGTRNSTIMPTNRRLEGNLRIRTVFLEHSTQNPEAHPRSSRQAMSYGNGGP